MGMILTKENYPPFWKVYWHEMHSTPVINSLGWQKIINDYGNVFFTTNPDTGELECTGYRDEAIEFSLSAKQRGFDFDDLEDNESVDNEGEKVILWSSF